jgi:hypothetical protein
MALSKIKGLVIIIPGVGEDITAIQVCISAPTPAAFACGINQTTPKQTQLHHKAMRPKETHPKQLQLHHKAMRPKEMHPKQIHLHHKAMRPKDMHPKQMFRPNQTQHQFNCPVAIPIAALPAAINSTFIDTKKDHIKVA